MSEPKKPSFLAGRGKGPAPANQEPAATPAQPAAPAAPAGGSPGFLKSITGTGAAKPPAGPSAPSIPPPNMADPEESQPEILPEEPAAPASAGGMVGIVKPLGEFPAGNRAQAEQLLVKGLDQYDQEQLDVALAFYQRAIDADLSFSMAHNSLGMVLIDLERYPEAIEAIKNAVRIDPKNSEALSNLGFVYRRTGNDGQAAVAYTQYLALEADDEQGPKIRTWVESVQAQMGGKLPELDLSLPAGAGAKPKAAAAKVSAAPPAMAAAPAAAAPAAAAPAAPAAPRPQHESLPKSDKPPAKPVPLAPIPSPGARASGAVSAAPPPLGGKASGARPSAAPPPRAGAAPAAESQEDLDPQELYEEMLDLFDHEDYAQVRTYAKKILEIEPTHLSTRIIEGKVLTCEKNYQDAVVFFANLLESAPKDPSIYYFLGYCLRALEQDMEAAEAFTKFLELMPTAVDASKTAAWIQKVTGKPMGARSTQPQGVAIPSAASGRAAAGGAAEPHAEVYIPGEGEIEVQEELGEKELKKYQRGVTAFQEGNLEGAQKYIDQFLAEHEKFSDAHVLKARIQLRNREYDMAISSIQRAIQLNPTSSEAYYYLGQAYEKHGKLAESRACYQRTLELEPEGPRAEHLREWLERANQAASTAQAEVVCERCLRKFETRYVTQYEEKHTCRWCLDLIEAQVGGGLVAQYFPELVREEEERDQVDGSRSTANWLQMGDGAGAGSKKMVLVAVVLLLLIGGAVAAWYLTQNKPDQPIDPGNNGDKPPVVVEKFDPKQFKLSLLAAKTELLPDEPFEADLNLEGEQPKLAEVTLELEGCPEGVHLSADRKKLLWQTPPSFDPILANPTNPFKLTVVAIAKDKETKRKLATEKSELVVSVQKMDSAVSEAKNYTWVHDQPANLLPMERITWQIQGRSTATLQLQAKIVKAPPGAKIAMVNGVPTMNWQAPLETSVDTIKQKKKYDFELEMSVAKKDQPNTTFFPKPYTFSVETGWSISTPREIDLKVDPMDQVTLGVGNLVQAPGEYPDDVLVATGHPLRDGMLRYLNFIDAGETLNMSEAFQVKLGGFPYTVMTGQIYQQKSNRDDVIAVDLFQRRLLVVPQAANGLPAKAGIPLSVPNTPGDLLLMDVNRDGKNDLVRADLHGNKLYVTLMGEDGKLATDGQGGLTGLECPVDDYAAPVRLVNLRTRNRLALVSSAPGGKVKVQLLEAKWPPAGPAPIVPVGAPVTDIGADGARWFVDAVMINTADREWLGVLTGSDTTSTLEVYRPAGDTLQHRPADPKSLGSLTLPADIVAPPSRVYSVDLNRDGLDDLVIGYPHRIDIYWQISGDTSQWLLVQSVTDKNFTGDFVLADVNRDSRLDLVVYDARQKLDVFLIK